MADTGGRVTRGRRARGSAGERVALHLRTLIQRGRLKPGDRLPTERELAAELGVSRPSVRSALQQLAAMGLVKARRRAGTFIQSGPPALDSQPLKLLAALHDLSSEEIFEARGALEVFAAGLAARRATRGAAARHRGHGDGDVRVHRRPASVPAERRALPPDGGRGVPTTPSSRRWWTWWRRWSTSVGHPPSNGASDLRDAAQMHQRVYDAIRRRNAAAARDAMAEHLRVALEGWAAEGARRAGPRLRAARVMSALTLAGADRGREESDP